MKNIGYTNRGPFSKITGLPFAPALLPRTANRSRYQPKILSKGRVIWDSRRGQYRSTKER